MHTSHNNKITTVIACLQKLYWTNKGCKLYYILNENDVKPKGCPKWKEKLNENNTAVFILYTQFMTLI